MNFYPTLPGTTRHRIPSTLSSGRVEVLEEMTAVAAMRGTVLAARKKTLIPCLEEGFQQLKLKMKVNITNGTKLLVKKVLSTTKDKHSPNSPMVSKDANPAFDESDEGDYDIALDVLRSLTAEDKSIKLFEEKGPPEIDIDPAPVNNILATSESIGITSVPSGEHFNITSPAVSYQGSPMLPKR